MASQSLYRKWRSQTFSDLVGQEPVIRTLQNALKDGKLAHAYLFTGPRGTGKTSTARLLAKTINCLHPVNHEPCNECQQCREITAGNSFNVIEIDAASNRGIDSIRELREKVMVPPSTGRYKVYILDEAHMLTVEAFNALLKTLEEPPPHAIFVMATTDVHKMLPTVLSRCQRFDFKRITTRQIVEHLCFIAEQEQVQLERVAAELIARAAAGGMRDALSLLDQAIAYAGQSIQLSQVQAMLGIADPRAIQKFILHIANLDSSAGLHLIHELAEAGADLRQINNQVAEYWRAMMLCKAGANIAEILDTTEDEVREIAEAAKLFALEELIECARIFAQNDLMQKNQGTPQLGLELALLSCVGLHSRAQTGQPLTAGPAVLPAQPMPATSPRTVSPQQQPQREAPAGVSSPPRETPASPPVQTTPAPNKLPDEQVQRPQRESFVASHASSPTSLSSRVEESASVQSQPVTPQPAASDGQPAGDPPSLTVAEVKEKWEFVKRRVKTKKDGAIVAALLNDLPVVLIEGTAAQPILVMRASAEFHYKAIHKSEERQRLIEWALKIELGQECRIRLLSPGQSVPLPPPPALSIQTPHRSDIASGSIAVPPLQRQPDDGRNGSSSPHGSAGNSTMFTMSAAPAQASPHLERPGTAQSTMPPPPQNVMPLVEMQQPSPPVRQSQTPGPVSTLARMESVRENSKATSLATPLESIRRSNAGRQEQVEKKAKNDPVVQEVMRMFKADIKDIHLK
ncbi:DNA polymerase III subunit gamma/tau [Reticulibacter mediterranei]|uniref:DNA polymerase III subunit gamma/tau n=1 Tax=Reticulibacter mediterranei TaxID=2778369 RepID=A0A8J3N0I6_9CHLR|nr:DNA polymerase III subunit gamma/tau [Reticulibacter mediterranei]GHO91285.1 DNA polymerase III subunit gamma/tau [Reticulibacter mediterranei]